MALGAGQLLVKGLEWKTGTGFVVESFGLFLDMAQRTVISYIMAFFTILMGIVPDMRRMGLWVMATATALFAMAIDTLQAEQVGVFLMMESHHRTIGNLGGFVNIFFGSFDGGVWTPHYIESAILILRRG